MASVNKVILVGHLGKDPELRYLPSGDAVANFSIATSEKWKNKDGEQQEQTEWHRISLFGKVAEIAGEYLRKGSLVYIEGKLQTRKWSDKDGNDRYTTEIRGDRMQMLGGKREEGDASPQQRERAEPAKGASDYAAASGRGSAPKKDGGLADMDDDIPF